MWRILQHERADDWVLATGKTETVRRFVELAFAEVGRTIAWRGEGVDEIGVDAATGETLVAIDPAYFRPTEVDLLLGDPSKAERELGWRHTTRLEELVKEMVAADLEAARR
jgi:GDPmannose 4,6-dehydratase